MTHSRNISAGIDTGMEVTKAVLLDESNEYYSACVPGGIERTTTVAKRALEFAAQKAGVALSDISKTVVTGIGGKYVTFADREIPEAMALARGIDHIQPSVRTLVDMGARKSLIVKCEDGKAIKVAESNKCAAGSGIYIEMVANVLKIARDRIQDSYFKSTKDVQIESPCAVFAESEIISLLHGGEKAEDIVRGVIVGLAGRMKSQMKRIGMEQDVAVVGGIAQSAAMMDALENVLEVKVFRPEDVETVGALGAALFAREEGRQQS